MEIFEYNWVLLSWCVLSNCQLRAKNSHSDLTNKYRATKKLNKFNWICMSFGCPLNCHLSVFFWSWNCTNRVFKCENSTLCVVDAAVSLWISQHTNPYRHWWITSKNQIFLYWNLNTRFTFWKLLHYLFCFFIQSCCTDVDMKEFLWPFVWS